MPKKLSLRLEILLFTAFVAVSAFLFSGCDPLSSTPTQAQSLVKSDYCGVESTDCKTPKVSDLSRCQFRKSIGWYSCKCVNSPAQNDFNRSRGMAWDNDLDCLDNNYNIPFGALDVSKSMAQSRAAGLAQDPITFLRQGAMFLLDFGMEGTTTVTGYVGAAFRQTNGSFTVNTFKRTETSTAFFSAITNAQTYFAQTAGLASPTLVAHSTFLADLPGTGSLPMIVTKLSSSAAYSGVTTGSSDISVSNGAATALFSAKTSVALSGAYNPISLLASDFNIDGKRDIAVLNANLTNSDAGAVSILRGNGDGTLQTAVNTTVGTRPLAMTAADFNHDGRPDIAVANRGDSATPSTQSISILLVNSSGAFTVSQTVSIPGALSYTTPVAIVAADFDGDGHTDLMAGVQGLGLVMLRGSATGSFTAVAAKTGYDLKSYPSFLVPADFNKDGKIDLGVVNQDGTVSILLNAGDGSFPNVNRYVAGSQMSTGLYAPGAFAMDFNDDGNLDLVLGAGHPDALYPTPTHVTVLYGRGDGSLIAPPIVPTNSYPAAMVSADFDGDGVLDLVVSSDLSSGSQNPSVSFLRGKRSGGFEAYVGLPSSSGSYAWIGTADANGDGKLDVMATDTSNFLYVWLGNGDGTFQAKTSATTSTTSYFASTAAVGDLTGDGRADAVVAFGDRNLISGRPSQVAVLTAKTPSGFNAPVLLTTGLNTVAVALADLNGDGKLDLVSANFGYKANSPTPAVAGSVTVNLGNGNGTFQAAVAYTVAQNPGAVSIFDINKDGKLDLIIGTTTGENARVAVLFGRGDGTFQNPLITTSVSQLKKFAVADFDADGKWDLAVVHTKGDRPFGILRGLGNGMFEDEIAYFAGYYPTDLAVSDFNGDCRPDIALTTYPDSVPGFLSLFQNTSATAQACVATTVTTSPEGRSIVVDGATLTSPQSFTWTPGSSHSISVPSPQAAGSGRYAFSSWSDGGAQSHTITAPSTTSTFTATFAGPQYPLTLTASPSAGGRIVASPASTDGYYTSGTSVQLTAQPNAGYSFGGWTGDLSGSTNPQTLVMSAARSATASFAAGGATFTISGRITVNGAGAGGVAVNITGWATVSTTTDSNGNYSFNSMPGGGTYTVTPSPGAYFFSPASTTISNLATNRTADFTGVSGNGLRFVPLAPCRVMETRSLYNFEGRTGAFGPPTINAAETRTLNLPTSNVCAIPSTAKAYVVNVTVIPNGGGVNFVTLWPAGDPRPNVWTIRAPDGQVVANSAIVKAGANGGISVYSSDKTDLLIDISGYYTDSPSVSGLVYYPLTPCRVIDTRSDYRSPAGPFGPPSMGAQETRSFRFPVGPYCTVPVASAYSVTVTVVPPAALAYLTAWPTGSSQPNVSSINSFAGRVLANSVIIPANSDGSINVFTYNATDFIIDINGYYAPDDGVNGLYYTPVTQCRASDSTVSGGVYADDTARTINVPAAAGCSGIPANAKGYAINVTALPNNNPMPFLTAYPTGQSRPNASILNAFQGQIVTNAAIIPAGPNGAIDIYAYRRTDVVVEISGYFGR